MRSSSVSPPRIHATLREGERLADLVPILPTTDPPLPPPTLEEVDVIREREISWKGVSAIILLLLKWFKCSRKFRSSHSVCFNGFDPSRCALQTSSSSSTSASCW